MYTSVFSRKFKYLSEIRNRYPEITISRIDPLIRIPQLPVFWSLNRSYEDNLYVKIERMV